MVPHSPRRFSSWRPTLYLQLICVLDNSYFLDQNAKIAAGSLAGVPFNLKVLGVGDGLTVSPDFCKLYARTKRYRTHSPNTRDTSPMPRATLTTLSFLRLSSAEPTRLGPRLAAAVLR